MTEFLSIEFLGNSIRQWSLAAGACGLVAAAITLALILIRRRITAWAARTSNGFDDIFAEMVHATSGWFIAVVAVMAGAQVLTLPADLRLAMVRVFSLVVIVQAGLWANAAVRGWLIAYLAARREGDRAGATTATVLGFITRAVLWSVVVLVMLENIGLDVTALVASLGIGGVAVALALQNVLGDIFASLAIALDKPLVIGDFIIVGDIMGTVERVGLKTTHLRSLSGELVIIANSDLLGSRIRNYKRMFERRVVFGFGVTYETPPETLARIPQMLRTIIEEEALARFDRAHFAVFGASALEFEVVYHVRDPDYGKYMDVQQRINLGLITALRAAGVEFAYPTQTIHLATPVGAGQ